MYLSADTLDDLLRDVLARLLKSRTRVGATRGPSTELSGVLLKLRNPRARLSITERRCRISSCLGELLWYLSKSNSLRFIKYYVKEYSANSDDGKTIFGAYGPRLFNMRNHDQIANVITLLRKKPESRRAVIQLFNAEDLVGHRKEIPCTSTLQFMIRRGRLNLLTSMRSNDAYKGLPHDVFAFTMLQEILARTLGVDLGTYKHSVGSLHLYESDRAGAQQFLDEGWQPSDTAMPAMPLGDPWPSVRLLVKAEARVRRGGDAGHLKRELRPFWQDLLRLLEIYFHFTRNDAPAMTRVKRQLSTQRYDSYIDRKKSLADRRRAASEGRPPFPEQLSLLPKKRERGAIE